MKLTGRVTFSDLGPGVYSLETPDQTYNLTGDLNRVKTLVDHTVTIEGNVDEFGIGFGMTGNTNFVVDNIEPR